MPLQLSQVDAFTSQPFAARGGVLRVEPAGDRVRAWAARR